MKPKCGLTGCTLDHYAKGYCRAHYARQAQGSSNIGPVKTRQAVRPRGLCTASSCTKAHYALGLCQAHYNSLKWGERVGEDTPRCTVPGCTFRHVAKGFCIGHYSAFRAQAKRAELLAQIQSE